MDTILPSKKIAAVKRIKKNYSLFFNGDPLNKRMLKIIDPGLKLELEKLKGKSH
jgi:hypothetical protein